MLEAEGHAALGEMVAAVQARFPGHRFHRTSGVDVHHDQLRFAWELRGPDGAVAAAGIDVGGLASDGRLARITGFFGEVPALAARLTARTPHPAPRPVALVLHSPSGTVAPAARAPDGEMRAWRGDEEVVAKILKI